MAGWSPRWAGAHPAQPRSGGGGLVGGGGRADDSNCFAIEQIEETGTAIFLQFAWKIETFSGWRLELPLGKSRALIAY